MLGVPGLNKSFLYVTIGVAAALALDSTIAGLLNPILAPLKLTYGA